MSAAEQIIAEHRLVLDRYEDDSCWCGQRMHRSEHAAHVVAALTNAGKTIVELPEPEFGKPEDLDPGDDPRVWHGHVRSYWAQEGEVFDTLGGRRPASGAMRDGLALLAAARVAEGGER